MKRLIAGDDLLILKTFQFESATVGDKHIFSQQGRDIMEQCNHDRLIADTRLPYFSELRIPGTIKQTGNPVPVIVQSSMKQQPVIDKARYRRADKFNLKPFDISTPLTVTRILQMATALLN